MSRPQGTGLALYRELQAATADPWADPVTVRGVAITRAEARAMERGLWLGEVQSLRTAAARLVT